MSHTGMHFTPCRAILLICGCLGLVVLPGCGKGTCKVQGKVVYEDGQQAGNELEGYSVTFESEEDRVSASGLIGSDGTFEVGTFENADGAVAGRHRVAITPPMHERGREARLDSGSPPSEPDVRFSRIRLSG